MPRKTHISKEYPVDSHDNGPIVHPPVIRKKITAQSAMPNPVEFVKRLLAVTMNLSYALNERERQLLFISITEAQCTELNAYIMAHQQLFTVPGHPQFFENIVSDAWQRDYDPHHLSKTNLLHRILLAWCTDLVAEIMLGKWKPGNTRTTTIGPIRIVITGDSVSVNPVNSVFTATV